MLESVKKYRKGTVLGALGNAMFLSSIVVMVVIMILQRVVLYLRFSSLLRTSWLSTIFKILIYGSTQYLYVFVINLTGQKGKPEFLKDDDEFDVNTVKGTKRPAPNKAQGYCLYLDIQFTLKKSLCM
jgi:hypothetical protein